MSVTTTNTAAQTGAFTLASAKHRTPDGVSLVITNECDWDLFILLGDGTPSATNYTYALYGRLISQSFGLRSPTLEIRDISYTGPVKGLWLLQPQTGGVTPTGQALVTEFG